MTITRLVPDRPEDLDRLPDVRDAFAFGSRAPGWSLEESERTRAAGRLIGFVALAGLGTGLGLWIAGAIVTSVIRGLLS
jgi:hypothetical protein